jgi:3-keto-disaccharide hydrolase
VAAMNPDGWIMWNNTRRIVQRYGRHWAVLCVALALGVTAPVTAQQRQWPIHSMDRPRPRIVTPGRAGPPVPPPSDAIVLFDGSSLSEWQGENGQPAAWKLGDGYFEVAPGTGSIETRRRFGDVQLHIEFATPSPPSGEGQDRGNSGVFLMGYYEVQVLDSYQSDTYADGQAAAVYGQYPPLVNASRAPGEWQTYDIIFRRPRFDPDGSVREPARMTVMHNGVLVQDDVSLKGRTAHQTPPSYQPHEDRRALALQDHGHRVRFRNIWVRELSDQH